ncbi:MAG: hypothetical protein HOD01_08305 [Oceanospirillaceae bacterium]|jgi:hypothetical protein|nr:hypothetical protein [Oceanospirillaceae bacterium]MBT4443298.1 hypothetical protein [Oceanospirillaceae bacterium]
MKSSKSYTHILIIIICLGLSLLVDFKTGIWSWLLVAAVFELVLFTKLKKQINKD